MPSWSDILNDLNKQKDIIPALDATRRGYLKSVSDLTGRNVIAYYSGWLKSPGADFRSGASVTPDSRNSRRI